MTRVVLLSEEFQFFSWFLSVPVHFHRSSVHSTFFNIFSLIFWKRTKYFTMDTPDEWMPLIWFLWLISSWEIPSHQVIFPCLFSFIASFSNNYKYWALCLECKHRTISLFYWISFFSFRPHYFSYKKLIIFSKMFCLFELIVPVNPV